MRSGYRSRSQGGGGTPRRRPGALPVVGVLLAMGVLAGCGAAGEEEVPAIDEGDTTTEPDTDQQAPDDDGAAEADDPGDDAAAEGPEAAEAVADAAERTGREADDIEVVAFERVTWADGALGCPEPEGMYTQALVEGYRVVLQAGDEELTYHGADGQSPFLCEDPQSPAEFDG